jgi:endonuclease III
VKPADKVRAILRRALHTPSTRPYNAAGYPQDLLDVVIFHKLHQTTGAARALGSYRKLREHFVDWNEVRVSSLREIQEHLLDPETSLDVAIFIKDFLEFVHREQHNLSLEFLATRNQAEIRGYLLRIRGVESSTVNLILHLRKQLPVVPLNRPMETVLERLGVTRPKLPLPQKERQLHALVPEERILALHHFLLNHSLEVCPPDDRSLDCPHCRLRGICSYYERKGVKRRSRGARRHRSREMRRVVAAKRVRRSTPRR